MKLIKTNETKEEETNITKAQLIRQILNIKNNNNKCFDCKKLNPDIISLYNGIFICKECAKIIHSKLNNNINLIIDNNLQNLSLKGIKYLYYGGNKRLSDFVNDEYPSLKFINKNIFYMTKAMHYYRKWLKYLVNGGNKPLKPSYEDYYNIYINEKEKSQKKNKTKKRKAALDINTNLYNENKNYSKEFKKISKKEDKKIEKGSFIGKNSEINTFILDNENNYFFLSDSNPNNNLNITTIKKDNQFDYKNQFILDKKLSCTSRGINKIYSKPNLLIPKYSQTNSDSFIKVQKSNNNKYNIHNSILFPNRNNNYFLLNSNTYNNTLMNNFLIGAKTSRDYYNHNNFSYNNKSLSKTFFNSVNKENSYEGFLKHKSFIFKKKSLKNSFSLSKKNKKVNKQINRLDNISIIEANNFQIIPNLKKKNLKRKINIINLRDKPEISDEKSKFNFYTMTEIRKKEKENILKKRINSIKEAHNKINKKVDINKLINLIIEIKKKHKNKNSLDSNKNNDYLSTNVKTLKIKKKEIEAHIKETQINKEKNSNDNIISNILFNFNKEE